MSAALRAPGTASARDIARAFLPEGRLGNRWNYYYARAKLGSDPLYAGVSDALRGTRAPLLDLGCGLGLLAHTLRADGVDIAYHGVDLDAGKVAQAAHAARRAQLPEATFAAFDLTGGLPAHAGSVAILDVLQYLPGTAQDAVVDGAIAMLVPGARLVIRTGLGDGGARARFTHLADRIGNLTGWMVSPPRAYPRGDALRARLEAAGLAVRLEPLHAGTPFNNWRVVAERTG